jgi:hypothetical protein
MTFLLPLLMFSLGSAADAVPSASAGSEVFRCVFDESNDKDYDGWPDGWRRRHGPGFPNYVHVKICDESPPERDPRAAAGRSLRVDLDGGGAVAYGPAIPISRLSAYVLEALVRTENLKHDRVFLSLTLLSEDRRRLRSVVSEPAANRPGWQTLRLGPFVPDAAASQAVIGLHVEPPSEAEDLRGAALFAGLRMARFPRMTLESDANGAPRSTSGRCPACPTVASALLDEPAAAPRAGATLFTDPRAVEIRCTASGIDAPSAAIVFQLADVRGQIVAEETRPMVFPRGTGAGDGAAASSASGENRLGEAVWRPAVPQNGFYRVHAGLYTSAEHRAATAQSELTLVVLEPQHTAADSEFGWSLSPRTAGLPLPLLADVLCQSGIRRLKCPVACGPTAGHLAAEAQVAFHERLQQEGITVIGLLCPTAAHAVAANVFGGDAKEWYPSLEPMLARLGIYFRWWQLGEDRDAGWSACPDRTARIASAKAALDRIGQNVHVGIGWDWNVAVPRAARPGAAAPWSFVSLLAESATSDRELGRQLERVSPPSSGKNALETVEIRRQQRGTSVGHAPDAVRGGAGRWVTVQPLPAEGHSREDRAAHLVRQIVAAKIAGAEGIFAADPLDGQRGLVREDLTPAELFLPWRTTALCLGGAKYVGRIELPRGSVCHLFSRGGGLLAVVWNDRPVEETIYLGAHVRQLDLWGGCRDGSPPAAAGDSAAVAKGAAPAEDRCVLHVDRVPTFLTGLDEPIIRWQQTVALGQDRAESVVAEPLANALHLRNDFARAIRGWATITPPAHWHVVPARIEFHLAAGESREQPLEITLPSDATAGANLLHVAFEIHADRVYHLGMDRSLNVGMGDLRLEVTTRLNPRGELEVRQTLINGGRQSVSFRCGLLAPDRKRQPAWIVALPTGRDQQVYRLPEGKDLLGKTLWLRAEEIDGPRVLNYRFVAQSPLPDGS